MQSGAYNSVREGMDVLDRNGDKIGNASDERLGQYFKVDSGLFGMTEYYIPFSAITEVRGDDVYLNVDKDTLGTMDWDRRPAEGEFAASGMAAAAGEGEYGRGRIGSTEGETLQLREEELGVSKTAFEAGEVRLETDIVEEQRTIEVPVSREEVTIERHPVDRRPADRPIGEEDTDTISVSLTEERVEVQKRPVVYEEVSIGKTRTEETQQVSGTVRREELRTETSGDVDLDDRDTRPR